MLHKMDDFKKYGRKPIFINHLKLPNMKKSIIMATLVIASVGILAFASGKSNAKTDFNQSFAQTLKNAKVYTIEVAEKMPAEDYTFKPHDSVRSFGEQLAHIGMSTQFLHTMFIKGEAIEFDPAASAQMEKEIGASKEKAIEHINKSFDDAIATLESMSAEDLDETFVFQFIPSKPELTKEQGYLFIRDHITHHRGQAIMYLRIKGHDAPQYRPF